jgi:hypothetical protein
MVSDEVCAFEKRSGQPLLKKGISNSLSIFNAAKLQRAIGDQLTGKNIATALTDTHR